MDIGYLDRQSVDTIVNARKIEDAWEELRKTAQECGFDRLIYGFNRLRRVGDFGNSSDSYFLSDLPKNLVDRLVRPLTGRVEVHLDLAEERTQQLSHRAHFGRGVVRDPAVRQACVDRVVAWLDDEAGWDVMGVEESPITGAEGNVEFLVAATKRP